MNNKSWVNKRAFKSLQYVPLRNCSVTEGVNLVTGIISKAKTVMKCVVFPIIDLDCNGMPSNGSHVINNMS
jgi:hypothetical protein